MTNTTRAFSQHGCAKKLHKYWMNSPCTSCTALHGARTQEHLRITLKRFLKEKNGGDSVFGGVSDSVLGARSTSLVQSLLV